MLIYEITVTVDAGLVEKYEKHMRVRHIPDLLATGRFDAAYFTHAGDNRYRIQYHAPDRAALDAYFENEAEALRTDFLEHFPEGVEVSREIWEIVESWSQK